MQLYVRRFCDIPDAKNIKSAKRGEGEENAIISDENNDRATARNLDGGRRATGKGHSAMPTRKQIRRMGKIRRRSEKKNN